MSEPQGLNPAMVPDTKADAAKLFGIKTAMQVPACARPLPLDDQIAAARSAHPTGRYETVVMAEYENAPTLASRTDLGGAADWKFAEATSRDIFARFEAGELDEVDLIYTRFRSALSRDVVLEPYIPLGSEALKGADAEKRPAGGVRRDYIYEPDPGTILTRIVPYFLAMRLYMAMAGSAASEHGARMIAMGSATKNANEMIQTLTLHMNRTRQATITREIVEIVGGAEALK